MAAPPDLLRERRMELGLSPDAPFHEPLVQLLTKGAIVATAPVIVCCGVAGGHAHRCFTGNCVTPASTSPVHES